MFYPAREGDFGGNAAESHDRISAALPRSVKRRLQALSSPEVRENLILLSSNLARESSLTVGERLVLSPLRNQLIHEEHHLQTLDPVADATTDNSFHLSNQLKLPFKFGSRLPSSEELESTITEIHPELSGSAFLLQVVFLSATQQLLDEYHPKDKQDEKALKVLRNYCFKGEKPNEESMATLTTWYERNRETISQGLQVLALGTIQAELPTPEQKRLLALLHKQDYGGGLNNPFTANDRLELKAGQSQLWAYAYLSRSRSIDVTKKAFLTSLFPAEDQQFFANLNFVFDFLTGSVSFPELQQRRNDLTTLFQKIPQSSLFYNLLRHIYALDSLNSNPEDLSVICGGFFAKYFYLSQDKFQRITALTYDVNISELARWHYALQSIKHADGLPSEKRQQNQIFHSLERAHKVYTSTNRNLERAVVKALKNTEKPLKEGITGCANYLFEDSIGNGLLFAENDEYGRSRKVIDTIAGHHSRRRGPLGWL